MYCIKLFYMNDTIILSFQKIHSILGCEFWKNTCSP